MAGGRGERMRRSGSPTPKLLTPLGGVPLVVHLCRHLRLHGVDRIVVALGHRAAETGVELDRLRSERPDLDLDWLDTGSDCGNGGRLLRLGRYSPARPFLMCWCAAVADLDLGAMTAFHARRRRLATLAAVPEPPRWGQLALQGERVVELREKESVDQRWINGGYFVLEPEAIDQVRDIGDSWERGALQRLIATDQLNAWRHRGFWSAIDTLADRDRVEARLPAILRQRASA